MVVLCPLDAIDDGAAIIRQAVLNGQTTELVLVRRGETVWAYRNRCPHFSVGLDAQPGVVYTYRGEIMMCAHHSAMFRFEDGLCIDGPCRGHRLDAVAVKVKNHKVICMENAIDPHRGSSSASSRS